MPSSIAFLLLLALLLIVLGLLAAGAILLVAKRKPTKTHLPDSTNNIDPELINPWEEAGKRIKSDLDEP